MGAQRQPNANSWLAEFGEQLVQSMRAEWRDKAACTDADPDLFDNYFGGKWVNPYALEICHSCPVIEQCRDHAIAFEAFGTWGGLSEKEREHIRGRTATRRLNSHGY